MKKIISIILLELLIFNGFSIIAFTEPVQYDNNHYKMLYENSNANPRNPLDSLKEFKECIQCKEPRFGIGRDIFRKYPVMDTTIRDAFSDESSDLVVTTITELPDYFSWTDYNGKDWTTPARNQGDCGSCWLFAAIGALESIINIREGYADLDPDLSEQYVLSCLPSAGSCRGGTVEGALYYIMDTSDAGNHCNGVITEICFPYQASDDVPCSEKSDDWREYLVPIENFRHVDLGYDTYRMREVLKSWIMENGPVCTNMFVNKLFILWGNIFRNPIFHFPYIDAIDNIYNHCVVIVGWNDNPLIRRGGYWICKNSWGTDWGYNGFFNIEYGSLNVASEIIWVDYDSDSYDWSPVVFHSGFN